MSTEVRPAPPRRGPSPAPSNRNDAAPLLARLRDRVLAPQWHAPRNAEHRWRPAWAARQPHPRRILGISCFYHDAAACLVVDGALIAAAEEERYSRRKHDAGFPAEAIVDCLRRADLKGPDLDLVIFYENPLAKLERMAVFGLTHDADGDFSQHLARFVDNQRALETRLQTDFGYTGPLRYAEHHLSHLASAYYISGFDQAALLSIDGVGEWTTTAIGIGHGPEIRILEELDYPHSLGLFYSTFTAYLGFKVNNDEYKVMGMAAYGQPRFLPELHSILHVTDDGRYALGIEHFDFHRSRRRMFGDELIARFGPPRHPESEITQHHYDLAASVQRLCEQTMLGLARRAHELTGSRRLCLGGGVALNCLGNQRLLEDGPFEELVIQPAAGDSGGAVGAALWAASITGQTLRVSPVPGYTTCLGPSFTDEEIEAALRQAGASYRRCGSVELCRRTAELLSRDAVVAWFQGRMEFGPRALGSRSILASPLKPEMKEIINRRIKFREAFRPFAPVVPVERAAEFFELDRPQPYMLVTCRVQPEHRQTLPTITHADGTARVQTVARDQNPRYHDVLTAFGQITGVPVLVNTSFNVRGEPIVRTPAEAYRCFTLSDLDALVIGSFLVERPW